MTGLNDSGVTKRNYENIINQETCLFYLFWAWCLCLANIPSFVRLNLWNGSCTSLWRPDSGEEGRRQALWGFKVFKTDIYIQQHYFRHNATYNSICIFGFFSSLHVSSSVGHHQMLQLTPKLLYWLHQYKQGERMRDIDKLTTPQERKHFNNTNNNNNFKNKLF
jgi:hypothetical protein